jgi:hypothetical protein
MPLTWAFSRADPRPLTVALSEVSEEPVEEEMGVAVVVNTRARAVALAVAAVLRVTVVPETADTVVPAAMPLSKLSTNDPLAVAAALMETLVKTRDTLVPALTAALLRVTVFKRPS